MSDEVTLDAELFPTFLREGMITFFRKALRRNFSERFDNAEQMRIAWKDIFRHVDQPAGHRTRWDSEQWSWGRRSIFT